MWKSFRARYVGVITLLLLICSEPKANAQEDDLESRLAYLHLERDEIDRRKFSVLIEKYRMPELPDPKGGERLFSERILQRFARDGVGKSERIDAIKLNALDSQDVNKSLTEAQLANDIKGIHYRGKFPIDQRFESFQVRAGAKMIQTMSCRKHPFVMSVTQAVGNRRDGDTGTLFSINPKEKDVIDQKTLPDGRQYIKFYTTNSTAMALTFNKEQSWCIEQADCLADDSNIANTRRSDPSELKLYASNRTQWKKQSDYDQLLPYRIQLHYDSFVKESWEIRFAEWKHGDDVDMSLFDEANFTEDRIKASIDFQKVKRIFDDLGK